MDLLKNEFSDSIFDISKLIIESTIQKFCYINNKK